MLLISYLIPLAIGIAEIVFPIKEWPWTILSNMQSFVIMLMIFTWKPKAAK